MLSLQNMDGGLREKNEVRSKTEGKDWLGLWTLCVSSSYGASLTNTYIRVNQKLGGGVCMSLDGDLLLRLNATNGTKAV